MSSSDETRELLQDILSQLHNRNSQKKNNYKGSFLLAQDGQFLGQIINSKFNLDSILNPYGPYGSKYSQTSIFNKYSQYGSPYGCYSIRNSYTNRPPKLFINNIFKCYVTLNNYMKPRITPDIFLYNLENNINGLIVGNVIESENHLRQIKKESFIRGADGSYLGSLNPNQFDYNSIFNKFGPYGSQFSTVSIFNKFSLYGNRFSSYSAFNKFTCTPPRIYLNGKESAYLTKNTFLNPNIDPENILEWAEKNVRKSY